MCQSLRRKRKSDFMMCTSMMCLLASVWCERKWNSQPSVIPIAARRSKLTPTPLRHHFFCNSARWFGRFSTTLCIIKGFRFGSTEQEWHAFRHLTHKRKQLFNKTLKGLKMSQSQFASVQLSAAPAHFITQRNSVKIVTIDKMSCTKSLD